MKGVDNTSKNEGRPGGKRVGREGEGEQTWNKKEDEGDFLIYLKKGDCCEGLVAGR